MKTVAFATGCFYKWQWNIDKIIDYLTELHCKAVELTFAYREDFYRHNINDSTYDYLASLDYLSLHLPFRFTYRNDRETQEFISDILSFCKKTSVKNLVIHPNRIEDFSVISLLKSSGIKVSFEILGKGKGLTVKDYDRLLYDFEDTMIVLDVTHALTHSYEHLDYLVSWLGDNGRLSEIHISNYVNGKEHRPVNRDRKLVEKVEHFNVPFIIEVTYSPGDMRSSEMDFDFLTYNLTV
ncbi:MAG: hypothetical protein ABRQ37_22600 [Candidatus Eremiobacterota bacterium]